MTFITVIVLLLIDRVWFSKIIHKSSDLVRTITFYFVAMLMIHTPAPVLLLLGKQYYQLNFINNLVGNMYRGSILFIFFFHLMEALQLVLFTRILKKWVWKVMPFIFSFLLQSMFVKMGILVIEDTWNFGYTLIIYTVFITAYILIEKYTLKPN